MGVSSDGRSGSEAGSDRNLSLNSPHLDVGDDGWGWFVDGSPSPASSGLLSIADAGQGLIGGRAKTNSEDSSDSTNSRKVARTHRYGSSPGRNASGAQSGIDSATNLRRSSAAATAAAARFGEGRRTAAENLSPNSSSSDLRRLATAEEPQNHDDPPARAFKGSNRRADRAAGTSQIPSSRISANNSLLDLWSANLRVNSSTNLAGANNLFDGPSESAVSNEMPVTTTAAQGAAMVGGVKVSAAAAAGGDTTTLKPSSPARNKKIGVHGRVESFSFDFEM